MITEKQSDKSHFEFRNTTVCIMIRKTEEIIVRMRK